MKTDVFRKTLSVEAEDFFGNFVRLCNWSCSPWRWDARNWKSWRD